MWRIRDVDPETRKRIKWYAVQHNMSIAEALKALVELALDKSKIDWATRLHSGPAKPEDKIK
jgi:hypothetical protein